MIRLILYILFITVLSIGIAWIFDNPGKIAMDWRGWRLETTIPVLAFGLIACFAAFTVAFNLLVGIIRLPFAIVHYFRESRETAAQKSLLKGFELLESGRSGKAVSVARKIKQGSLAAPAALYLTGKAQELDGNFGEATEAFLRLRDTTPEAAVISLRELAKLAILRHAPEEALQYAVEALRINPALPWAVKTVFEAGKRLAKYDDTIAIVSAHKKHIDISEYKSWVSELYYLKARELVTNGKLDEAIESAGNAVAEKEDFTEGYLLAAECLISKGAPEKAIKSLTHLWQHLPDEKALAMIVEALKSEKPDHALKKAQSIARGNADHPLSQLLIARHLINNEQYEEARKILRECTGKSHDRLCFHMMADLEERESKDFEASARWLKKALEASDE